MDRYSREREREGGREEGFNINFALITNRCFDHLIIKRDSIHVYIIHAYTLYLYIVRNKTQLGRSKIDKINSNTKP